MTGAMRTRRRSASGGSSSIRLPPAATGPVDPTTSRTGPSRRGGAPLRHRDQTGVALVSVLAFTLVGTILLVAVLSFAFTGSRAVPAYRGRIDAVQANSDAMNLAIQAMRTDMSKGLDGTSSTYSYGTVSVTCVGEAGSGVVTGSGTADRTVSCSTTPEGLTTRVRFFDRSGSMSGALVEVLSWVQTG